MSEPSTRKRDVPYKGNPLEGKSWWEFWGVVYPSGSGRIDANGTQKTVSVGNQVSLLGDTDEDIGSAFYTTKVEILNIGSRIRVQDGPYKDSYEGDCMAVLPNDSKFPPDESSTDVALKAWGTTAISRVSPVSPHASVLTSLGELRKEGLPSLPGTTTWRNRTEVARNSGSEYLNIQFGWAPLVSEIQDVVMASRKASEHIDQLMRDNGRNVRRRYDEPREVDTVTETVETGNGVGIPVTLSPLTFYHFDDPLQRGTLIRQRETTRKRWFSGCFTYHVPLGDSNISRAIRSYQQANLLYGVALTPEVVWNLTPWSWATDWFANTGDILANASAAMMYGQVLRFGYVMETTITTDTYTRSTPGFHGGECFITTLRRTTKKRVKASPFGFGVDWDGLNTYQLSIIAALGMTRGSRSS